VTQTQAVCVYTKNDCQPCIRTKKELTLRGVAFTEVSVEEDAAALEYIKSLGHQGAPVVVLSGGDSWSGMRPDLINSNFGKRPTNV
jgi:glutaredoxin-like protein NrdH